MFSGSSLGGILFPFFITYFSSQFTARGALILMGGVWLHLCAAGLLLSFPIIKGNQHLNPKQTLDTEIHASPAIADRNNFKKKKASVEGINSEVYTANRKGFKSYLDLLTSFKSLLTVKCLTTVIFWYCATTGMNAVTQFLPAYAKQFGWSDKECSTLLAVMFTCDLLSRITFALVGDWKKINKSVLLTSVLTICGVLTLIFTLAPNKITFYLYAMVHGFLGEAVLVFLG